MTTTDPAPRRRTLRTRVFAVLGGLVIGLMLAELVVRVIGPGPERRVVFAGTPVTVAVFPARWDLEDGAYPLVTAHERVLGELRDRGLAGLDLRIAFEAVARETEAGLFEDHLHPDAAGHLVAALAILRELTESSAVPEGSLRLEAAREQPGAEGRFANLVLPGD